MPSLAAAGAMALAIAAAAAWGIARPDDADRIVVAPRAVDVEPELDAPFVDDVVAACEIRPERVVVDRERTPASARRAGRASAPDRGPRPGSERWHRARFDELARRDAGEFARTARERLLADGALAEKVALLLVANRADAALADELWAAAIEPGPAGDAGLRQAALLLLGRDAARSPAACARLARLALLDRRLAREQRRSAAFTVASFGDEAVLALAAAWMADEPDADVRAGFLRGLDRNPARGVEAGRDDAEPGSEGNGE